MFVLRIPIVFAVLFYQSVFLALGQIWNNKVRAMLTTIGIVIGVSSVTAVIAALTGLEKNVLTEFEAFGTNKVFIFPSRPDSGPMRNASPIHIRFQPPLFEGMLENCPSLRSFTRQTNLSEIVGYEDRTVESVDIEGIEPAWHDIENRVITIGRPFSLIDNEEARPVCLVNKTLQDSLGLPRDPSSSVVQMGGRQFLVIGVVENRAESAMFGGGGNGAEMFLPFKTAYMLARAKQSLPFIRVTGASKSPELSADAKAEVLFFLRKKRKIGPGEPDTFRVEFVDQFVQQFKRVAGAITIIATGIVGVSLLVGGVGIMNIMLVSVSERTREIGLRKAVGARPGAILLQFLVEAVMLCFFGGLVGVLIGEGLTRILASIPGAQLQNAAIPPWAIALSFGFAAAVGLVFGMFPAIKASRLDPIEALRHE